MGGDRALGDDLSVTAINDFLTSQVSFFFFFLFLLPP